MPEYPTLNRTSFKQMRVGNVFAYQPHTHIMNYESSLFSDSGDNYLQIGIHMIHKASPPSGKTNFKYCFTSRSFSRIQPLVAQAAPVTVLEKFKLYCNWERHGEFFLYRIIKCHLHIQNIFYKMYSFTLTIYWASKILNCQIFEGSLASTPRDNARQIQAQHFSLGKDCRADWVEN